MEKSMEGLISGLTPIQARKNGAVIARRPLGNENLKVYTSNGNLEATQIVYSNEWILTRANADGTPVIDEFGRKNQWALKADYDENGYVVKTADEKLMAKYSISSEYCHADRELFLNPKGEIQTFVQVPVDVALMVPWGEKGALIPQYIRKGGYINITNPDDIYGVAEEEFVETYEII